MPQDSDFQLSPQPWMTAPATAAVMAALAAGGTARFVGGAVRDALQGIDPAGEIDIATDVVPDRVMELLAAAKIRAIPTGIDHGTVTAVIDGAHFEITTLRRDVATYGRHADVAFTDDWREDAARRDFTINAMSLASDGVGFDYFGGRDDLAAGRVRFVGDAAARIDEDVLRILRFFRFHARYGKGAPDADAIRAITDAAQKVTSLSGERVWQELSRILTGPGPAAALGRMQDAGVLAHLVPGVHDIARLAALVDIEAALDETPDAVRRLAAITGAGAEDLARRLRLSRADRGRLTGLCVKSAGVTTATTEKDVRALIYRIGREAVRDRVLLAWAGAPGGGDAFRRLLDLAASFDPPTFPLGGNEAKDVGLAPGPAMGAALKAVEDWWVAEDFQPGHAALLARLKAEAKAR